jgi:hypothetical protein
MPEINQYFVKIYVTKLFKFIAFFSGIQKEHKKLKNCEFSIQITVESAAFGC